MFEHVARRQGGFVPAARGLKQIPLRKYIRSAVD
jgi:hypothetical protein